MTTSASGLARGKILATWIIGGLLLLFFLAVFAFAPEQLPEYKQRILAFLSAILAGLFGYFLTGKIKFTGIRSILGDIKVDATGGVALFVLVLGLWFSPFAPVSTVNGTAIVRVTVLGIDKIPIEDAQVWSSVGGEIKKVAGGWELEFPKIKIPEDGKVSVYSAQKSAYLKGQREIIINDVKHTTATIQLERDLSAQVKGTVSDADGKPLEGVTVSIVGAASSAVTNVQGFFSLPAIAADGEEIRLRVSKTGYETKDQYHPAGDDPAYILLPRKR